MFIQWPEIYHNQSWLFLWKFLGMSSLLGFKKWRENLVNCFQNPCPASCSAFPGLVLPSLSYAMYLNIICNDYKTFYGNKGKKNRYLTIYSRLLFGFFLVY
jgi:hypothetical protein